MSKRSICLLMAFVSITLFVIFCPGLPWSARCRYNLRRLTVKSAIRMARWRGQQPKSVTISGRLKDRDSSKLAGVQILALESTSGYGALTDNEGRFALPHLIWYPGAQYNLIMSSDTTPARRLIVTAPEAAPASDLIEIGELSADHGTLIGKEAPLFRSMTFDPEDGYYLNLYSRLTANATGDEEKIEAINRFVATRLNYQEQARRFPSPRAVIEKGSCYCSNLALAMAALTAAGRYATRTVHISDTPDYRNTHVVVEVYYGSQWHLYDPTYGISFVNKQGVVASYTELRLDPQLVTPGALQRLDAQQVCYIMSWMPAAYASGIHQIYRVDN